MSDEVNPYESPSDPVGSEHSSDHVQPIGMLLVFTMLVTSGIALLLWERLPFLAAACLCVGSYLSMSPDQRANARKQYTEPLSRRQVVGHLIPAFGLVGFMVFLGTSGFGTLATDTVAFMYGFKALLVIVWLRMVFPPWWRWFFQRGIPATTKQL